MKYIRQIVEELMANKRGTTKFIDTNSLKHVMKFEVIDDVR